MRHMAYIFAVMLIITGTMNLVFSNPDDGLENSINSPYSLSPNLMDLMSDVIFFVNYDDSTMKPSIYAGQQGLIQTLPYGWKSKPKPGMVYGEYSQGIVGKALKMPSGVGCYDAKANISLQTSGAIAFWFKPVNWKENPEKNIFFFSVPAGYMGIKRQARKTSRNNECKDVEIILAYIKYDIDQRTTSLPMWENIEDDKWHFIVLNWAWPTWGLSIDGKNFKTHTLPSNPGALVGAAKSFFLGTHGQAAETLMDEVMIFNRPLDISEVKMIYEKVSGKVNTKTSQNKKR